MKFLNVNLYMNKKKFLSTGLIAFIIGGILGGILWNFGSIPTYLPKEPTGPFYLFYASEELGKGVFATVTPEVRIEVNASRYKLPVDLKNVEGYADLKSFFGITSEQEKLLSENGFVVLRVNRFETLGDVYECLIDDSLPLLVTTDAVLHAYHVLFDETLKRAEMNELIDVMNNTVRTLLMEAGTEVQTYAGTPLEQSAKLNFLYLEVAYALINSEYSPTAPETSQELTLITAHEGFDFSPIFGYVEDYSQYVPRGHYTENERLKAYFKTMMWLGRMQFALMPNEYIDINQVRVQTEAAVLLTWMIQKTDIQNDWKRVYEVTKFFVGASDDLTFEDYQSVLDALSINDPKQLYDNSTIDEIIASVLPINKSKILGTYAWTYASLPQEHELQRILNQTAGLRFMGQRFIPDSYMFQQLVYPQVGTSANARLFPKSLDVPAVLGSELAEEILNETEAQYMNYTVQLNRLKSEFKTLDVMNWTKNLYWSWLYTLNTTLETVNSNYPTFMTTDAWGREKLQTFTGSWTELRHDTILYAKQSYTPLYGVGPFNPPTPDYNTAYVEPYPQTHLRLASLLNMTLNGLNGFQLLSEDIEESLSSFRGILKLFYDSSILELEGKELPQETQIAIREAAKEFAAILGVATEKTQKATIVADVHTDANTNSVLEEALGKFNILIVVYSDSEGKLYASAGPAYNYFEFIQPMSQRLTDEEWVELLANNPPEPPEWTEKFAP